MTLDEFLIKLSELEQKFEIGYGTSVIRGGLGSECPIPAWYVGKECNVAIDQSHKRSSFACGLGLGLNSKDARILSMANGGDQNCGYDVDRLRKRILQILELKEVR